MKTYGKGFGSRDQGFVSIFAVMLIMIVLSLLAVGFSSITRQAERRTLDDQLSTQAFYAAESGVNDASHIIDAATTSFTKTQCDGDLAGQPLNYTIDGALGVGYTCLLVDGGPLTYEEDPVPVTGAKDPIVTQIDPTPQPVQFFEFYWDAPANAPGDPSNLGPDVSGSPTLPNTATWGNHIGVVQVDIIPYTNGALGRATLVNDSYTFFLYGKNNASGRTTTVMNGVTVEGLDVTNGARNTGNTAFVHCNDPGALRCHAIIQLHLAAGGSPPIQNYKVRLQTLYNAVHLTMGIKNNAGTAMSMNGGQAVIDVTGKANDVLRRIRVRKELNGTLGPHPSFAVQSADSICKQLVTSPGETATNGSVDACVLGP